MNLKYRLLPFALLPGMMMGLISCSDDDGWQPGEPDGSMMVCFSELKKYDIRIEEEDSHLIPITITRGVYDDAVTIPLDIVEIPEGVTMPSSIEFLAGQESVTFNIDATAMPQKTSGNLLAKLPEEFTSIYAAGSPELDLSIEMLGSWVLLCEEITLTYSDYFEPTTTRLYKREEANEFKFENFLNSGVDLVFKLIKFTAEGWDNYYGICPVKNYASYDESYPGSFYIYDDANDYYPYIYPNGEDGPGLEYLCCYGYGYKYAYLSFDRAKAWWTFLDCCFLDTGDWEYVDITMTGLDPIFDPFEDFKFSDNDIYAK